MVYTSATFSTMRHLLPASIRVIAMAGAAFAAAGASAQTLQPPNSPLHPTHSVEMIAPAATVTSTVHYQAMVPFDCSVGGCTATFNRVRRNRQLNITRVWCDLVSDPTWLYGELYLRDRRGNVLLQEGLPLSASNAGFYQVNRAVDLQVAAGLTMQVVAAFSANITPQFGACTAAGTMSTLQ